MQFKLKIFSHEIRLSVAKHSHSFILYICVVIEPFSNRVECFKGVVDDVVWINELLGVP